MPRFARWPVILLAAALAGAAEEPKRQLGAHEHGHGKLSISVEGSTVAIELDVPGADVVGFEHEPSTPEQNAAVDAARLKLINASSLFRLPEGAGCRQIGGEVDMDGDDDDHGHGKEGKSPGAEHGANPGHSEVHAEWTLECTTPGALTAITFAYFQEFAAARELAVQVVTAKGASRFTVSREKPQLDLTGLM